MNNIKYDSLEFEKFLKKFQMFKNEISLLSDDISTELAKLPDLYNESKKAELTELNDEISKQLTIINNILEDDLVDLGNKKTKYDEAIQEIKGAFEKIN